MMDMIVAGVPVGGHARSVTFMLDHGQSNRYFNFIPDVKGTWHALSHYKERLGQDRGRRRRHVLESVEEKRAMYAEVIRWHHRQVAYLLGRMKVDSRSPTAARCSTTA